MSLEDLEGEIIPVELLKEYSIPKTIEVIEEEKIDWVIFHLKDCALLPIEEILNGTILGVVWGYIQEHSIILLEVTAPKQVIKIAFIARAERAPLFKIMLGNPKYIISDDERSLTLNDCHKVEEFFNAILEDING